MAETVVGRCPDRGHPITRNELGQITETCDCPGRMDGLFAASFGKQIKLTREPDTPDKRPGAIIEATDG